MNPEIWRYIFDAIEDPAFLHDMQFHVLLANRAYCRAAGMTEAQALGKPYWEVFPPGTGPLPGCKDAVDGKGQTSLQEEVNVGAKLFSSQEEVNVGEKRFLSKGYTVRDDQGKQLYSLHLLTDTTAQRQAEAELRKSNNFLQSVIENVPARIFWKDRDSRFLGCNTQFAKDAGYSRPDELTGKTDFEMEWKNQAELYRADDKATMESGTPKLNYEEPQTTPDGNTIWLRTSKLPLRNDSNQIIGILGFYQDITERKRAEQSLQNMATKFRTVFESSSDAILLFDEKGFSDCNPATLRMFGASSRDDFINKHPAQLSPPTQPGGEDSMRLANEHVATAFRNGSHQFEWMHCRLDGTEFPAEVVLTAMQLDGKPVLQGTVRDITERKRANEALARKERYYRKMIEGGTDVFFLMDHAGTLLYRSDSGKQLTGWETAEVLGKPVTNFVPAESLPLVRNAMAEIFAKPAQLTRVEVRILRKDGTQVETEILARNLLEDPDVAGIVITARDITERKRNELALERANRALRTLSACNEALVHAANESELLDSICRLIVETGGYRMAWVGFPEPDAAKTVRPVAQYGHDAGYVAAANISWADAELGRGPVGTAMRSGTVQVEQNFLASPALAPWRQAAQARGYQSITALPLKSAAGTLGVLSIYAAAPDAFNEAEVALLQELAGDLAFGLETLRTQAERDRIAYEHLHHTEILRQSLEDSIKAIANTVEMRDPYTAGHQRRVGQLAVAIARELGLPEETMRGIELAASIHDLGKISVPAEILSKPGKLTAIEFMLLKNHPQAGFDILKDIKFPWPIATMVLQHHERLDGSGYPQGLKGEQILLESRIMAVADVVEAMASHRPYRAALGVDLALQEIKQGRGTVYDAAVVDACLRLFTEKRFVFSI